MLIARARAAASFGYWWKGWGREKGRVRLRLWLWRWAARDENVLVAIVALWGGGIAQTDGRDDGDYSRFMSSFVRRFSVVSYGVLKGINK